VLELAFYVYLSWSVVILKWDAAFPWLLCRIKLLLSVIATTTIHAPAYHDSWQTVFRQLNLMIYPVTMNRNQPRTNRNNRDKTHYRTSAACIKPSLQWPLLIAGWVQDVRLTQLDVPWFRLKFLHLQWPDSTKRRSHINGINRIEAKDRPFKIFPRQSKDKSDTIYALMTIIALSW